MKGRSGKSRSSVSLLLTCVLLFATWPLVPAKAALAPATKTHHRALPAWAELPSPADSQTAPRPLAPVEGASRGSLLLPGGSTISGTLAFNDTWGPGTITVTGDIIINPGVTIDIAPGTTVRMATIDGLGLGADPARVEYLVAGTLQVNGPVTFTSLSPTPACADWVGIYFQAGSSGYLNDTLVEYGVHAVEINTANPITIAGSTLRSNCHMPPAGNAWGAGMTIYTGTHLVTNTLIHDNWVQAGIPGAWAEGGGVQIEPGAGPTLFQNCTLFDNTAVNLTQDAAGGGMNVLFADPILRHCEIYDNQVSAGQRAFGGGVNLDNSSGVIEMDSFVHDNIASATNANAYGGGVSIGQALTPGPPAPIIRSSRVTTNTLNSLFGMLSVGGGVGFYDGSWTQAVISDTLIADNTNLPGIPGPPSFVLGCGGGIGMSFGAMANEFDSNVIQRNMVLANGGGAAGGGICLFENNVVTVTNNLLFDNHADDPLIPPPAPFGGGGIYASAPPAQLFNNTIANNTTTAAGGGVYLASGFLFNNIVVNNLSAGDGGGVLWTGGPADFNDVWNNAPNDYGVTGFPRPPSDIVADPLFVGVGDLVTFHHLQQGSPAIDMGIGPVPGIPNHDYDGQARPLGLMWDMGFDEVQHYQIAKRVSATTAEMGDPLVYTVFLTNTDSVAPVVNGYIGDVLPPNTTYSGGPTCNLPSSGYDSGSRTVWWNGNVPPITTLSCAYTVTVNYGLADGSEITNTSNYTVGVTNAWSNVVTTTVHSPVFTLTKRAEGTAVVGAPFTYTIAVSNTSPNAAGSGVVVTDAVPIGGSWVSGGSHTGGVVTLNYPTIPANSRAEESWVVSTCQTSLVNEWYRVITSTARVDSGWGPTLTTNLAPPTINAGFVRAPAVVGVSETVRFTDTSATDGGPLVAWAWDFGDGGMGSGQSISHTYDTTGTYTVTLRITDTCGYAASAVLTDAVDVRTAVPNIEVDPLTLDVALDADDATARTVTISNAGSGDLDWTLAENPDRGWLVASPVSGTVPVGGPADAVSVSLDAAGLSTGTYTTTLHIMSNDPNEPQVMVAVTLVVSTACISVADAHIAYTPTAPQVGQMVTFSGTVQAGSPTLTYTWDFGDGGVAMGANVVHSFTAAMTYTVRMTASSSCNGSFDTDQVDVVVSEKAFYLYLPLMLKNH